MQSLVGPGEEDCPFVFNFDETTFAVGDMVSYRVDDQGLAGFPFVGRLVEVHDDHVIVVHDDGSANPKGTRMRGSRESRPLVSAADALD